MKPSRVLATLRPTALSTLALPFFLTTHLPAFAQTAADQAEAARQAEQLLRQQQELLRRDLESALPAERRAPGIDTRTITPKVDASAAGDKCHNITSVEVLGAVNLSPDLRAQLTHDFGNRCLGVRDIESVLGLITRDYMSRGYVTTRAYLPQQDLSKGVLQILVIEGKLEGIKLEDGARSSVRLESVFPRAGDLLNLRDLEQGIEQVNRLASNNATMDIAPGQTTGGSNVIIRNTPSTPFHASISADNQGSESTGRHQLGVTAMSDNLLNMNELLLVTHRRSVPRDTEHTHSTSNSFTSVIPFGYTTVSLNYSHSRYTSTFAAPSGADIQFKGASKTGSLRVDRLVHRDQTSRANLSGTLTVKDSKSWLAGQFLEVSSRSLTILDLDSSVSAPLLGGALSTDVGVAFGLNAFGALNDMSIIPADAPRAQFHKLKLGMNYMRPFKFAEQDMSWSFGLTGQATSDTLYGSEQIGIGGLYSVRGFVKNTLAGDQGYYMRNELSLRRNLMVSGERVGLRFFAGVDVGQVWNNVANVPSGRLVGMGVGVNVNWRGAAIELMSTRPLHMPDFFQRESPQAWVRVHYAI